jgi:hypothetical protein
MCTFWLNHVAEIANELFKWLYVTWFGVTMLR